MELSVLKLLPTIAVYVTAENQVLTPSIKTPHINSYWRMEEVGRSITHRVIGW